MCPNLESCQLKRQQAAQIFEGKVGAAGAQILNGVDRPGGDGHSAETIDRSTGDVVWRITDDVDAILRKCGLVEPLGTGHREQWQSAAVRALVPEGAAGKVVREPRGAQLHPGNALNIAGHQAKLCPKPRQPIKGVPNVWRMVGAQIGRDVPLVGLSCRREEGRQSRRDGAILHTGATQGTTDDSRISEARGLPQGTRIEMKVIYLGQRVADRLPMRRRHPPNERAVNIEEKEHAVLPARDVCVAALGRGWQSVRAAAMIAYGVAQVVSGRDAKARQRSRSMQLRFELGDPQAPRGHAILYARAGSGPERYIATYCVVMPIQFSIGKFLPPILSGQLPLGGLGDVGAMSVVPMPPMLEDVPGLDALQQLAERRGDDLCDMGSLYAAEDAQRMAYAAEAAQSYGELYEEYHARWPSPAQTSGAATPIPLDDLNVEDVLAEVLPERDRLGELAKLIGQARYAIEVHDQRLRDEVAEKMRRVARTLPEKYRADSLLEAALREDAPGAQLAELYLQRAYKLADEAYAEIPPIEQKIRALRGDDAGGDLPPTNG